MNSIFPFFFKNVLRPSSKTLSNPLQYFFARNTIKNKQIIDARSAAERNTTGQNTSSQSDQHVLDHEKQQALMKEAIEAFEKEKQTQADLLNRQSNTLKERKDSKENQTDKEKSIRKDNSKNKPKRETIMDKREKFKAVVESANDIEDAEVRRVTLLKDQKVQEQIQFERLRKASMNEERLSKYLSRSGVCSRRQAEKMISDGLIKVDGKTAQSNLPVTPRNNIEIFTKRGEKFAPVRRNAKIWIFYKPRGLICSHDDPLKRPNIFDYIYTNTKIKEPHIVAVGRLDYNSEGLILLTNDGDIAQCLEQPESHIYRQYRVRVQGKLDEAKFIKLKQGTVINGVQYGPFQVEIDRRQTTNTWLTIGLYTGKNREIRKVMQKFDLRVSRLKRESYGPYKVGKVIEKINQQECTQMLPGQIHETYVDDELKRKIYLYMRKRLELKQEDMKSFLLEKFGEDIFIADKSNEDLTLDVIAKRAYNALDGDSLKTQLKE